MSHAPDCPPDDAAAVRRSASVQNIYGLSHAATASYHPRRYRESRVPAEAANSNDRVPRYPPGTPGSSPIPLELADLDGVWTLSFGQFGWNEYNGRGAVVQIANGRMFGGGGNFVYQGRCVVVGEALDISIAVDRYRADANFSAATGLQADHYDVRCVADAITPDHFQGRISNEVRSTSGEIQEIILALVRFAS
jgi:hypothetical protein